MSRAANEKTATDEIATPATKNEAPAAIQPPRKRRKPATSPVLETARLESLEVRASKPVYRGGEPVTLQISLLNQAAKPASFLMLGPGFEFIVRRENRKVVLTYQGKEESRGDKVAYRAVPVGGKFEYSVLLSRVFDLSRAGNYVVECTKNLKNDNRDPGADLIGPRVVFRSVKFSVVEPDVATEKP